MSKQWKEFVQLFAEKNPHLTEEEVLEKAKIPFQKYKEYYELLESYLQKYGSFTENDICDPPYNRRIQIAGKTYNNVSEIPDHIFTTYTNAADYHLYIEGCLGNKLNPYIIQRLVSKLLRNREFITHFQEFLTFATIPSTIGEIRDKISVRNKQNTDLVYAADLERDRLWNILDDSASKLIHAGLINAGKPFIPRYSDDYDKYSKPCIYCDPKNYQRVKEETEQILTLQILLKEQERKRLQEEEILERKRLQEEEMLQIKKRLEEGSMWVCDACGFENEDSSKTCEICSTPKPAK